MKTFTLAACAVATLLGWALPASAQTDNKSTAQQGTRQNQSRATNTPRQNAARASNTPSTRENRPARSNDNKASSGVTKQGGALDNKSADLKLLEQVLRKFSNVKEQQEAWCRSSGKSRASFYRTLNRFRDAT